MIIITAEIRCFVFLLLKFIILYLTFLTGPFSGVSAALPINEKGYCFMKLLLPYFIIFIVVIQLSLRKNGKKDSESNSSFWAKEAKSNNVRKKNIDALPYIVIPDTLPFIDSPDPDIQAAQNEILCLKNKRILNLSGQTNTDLKMQYGPANLGALTEYDDNYTRLIRALSAAGKLLMDKGYETEGAAILEFGIACKSDITTNYTSLAGYYIRHGQSDRLSALTQQASELNSLSKPVILNKLKQLSDGALIAHTD